MTRRRLSWLVAGITAYAGIVAVVLSPAPVQETSCRYRIAWQSSITGVTGHGQPLSQEVAESGLRYVRRATPELVHWMQPVGCKN